MNIKRLKKIEWLIPICALVLCGISLVALYSASYDAGLDEFKKQAMWMGISFILMIVVTFIDYKILVKLSPILYGGALLALIAVLFTEPINGARSWFNIKDGLFSFQPAEMSKIFVILFMAYIISIIQRDGRQEINRISKLILILLAASKKLCINNNNKINTKDLFLFFTFFVFSSLSFFLIITNVIIIKITNNKTTKILLLLS